MFMWSRRINREGGIEDITMLFSEIYAICRKLPASVLLAFAVFGLLTPAIRAQQVAVAEIDGYVTDATGHAIVGGQVKAINVDTRQVRTASTDMTGRYALPNLPIGNYQLEISSAGFRTYVQKGIELEVASNRSIPVTLQIGAVSDSVQVTANAAQVETKENSVAQVVDQQRLIDLPLNGRNPADLLKITGFSTSVMNINGNDLTGSKNIQGSNGSGQYSIAGSAANGINFLLDGGDNNDSFTNVNLPIPFPDAVAEFNVQTNGLPAQYGLHPGGVVNIVTKSGGNALHGDIFDFLRNYELNARPKGTILGQSPRDSLKRNQFGGTAGGRTQTCLLTVALLSMAATLSAAPVSPYALNARVVPRPVTPEDVINYTNSGLPANIEVSGGLNTFAIGTPAYLEVEVTTNAAYAATITGIHWTLTPPLGSAAALTASPLPTNMPVFLPSEPIALSGGSAERTHGAAPGRGGYVHG